MSTTVLDAKALAAATLEIMRAGEPADFERIVHPDFVNREAVQEPPECRGRGPAAALATKRWLHEAFADLTWEIHDLVGEDALAVVHCTTSGRHTGDFVTFRPDGAVADVFPPTGRTFATTQSHWVRVADGLVVEHWANRDDMGTALQLGWVPPTPEYLGRMAEARERAERRYGAA